MISPSWRAVNRAKPWISSPLRRHHDLLDDLVAAAAAEDRAENSEVELARRRDRALRDTRRFRRPFRRFRPWRSSRGWRRRASSSVSLKRASLMLRGMSKGIPVPRKARHGVASRAVMTSGPRAGRNLSFGAAFMAFFGRGGRHHDDEIRRRQDEHAGRAIDARRRRGNARVEPGARFGIRADDAVDRGVHALLRDVHLDERADLARITQLRSPDQDAVDVGDGIERGGSQEVAPLRDGRDERCRRAARAGGSGSFPRRF